MKLFTKKDIGPAALLLTAMALGTVVVWSNWGAAAWRCPESVCGPANSAEDAATRAAKDKLRQAYNKLPLHFERI
jgi:hypothetical protein